MTTLPADFVDLLRRRAFAHLGVALRDGSVAVYPVWCHYDGHTLNFVSNKASGKYRVIRHNPRVTLCLSDPDNPYRYLEVRGTVQRIEEAGADAMLDDLTRKYTGLDAYPDRSQQGNRVIFRLTPEKVVAYVSRNFPPPN